VILSLISGYELVYQISLIDIFLLYLFLIKYHYNLQLVLSDLCYVHCMIDMSTCLKKVFLLFILLGA
jgi:hypothetical protein